MLPPPQAHVQAQVLAPIAASVAFVLELTLVPLLLTDLKSAFSLSMSELTWAFNAYGIAVAIAVLIGGRLGDLLDVGVLFRAGVALFIAGTIWVASTGQFESLLIARAIQGFGAGVFSPLIPVMLARAFPDRPGRILTQWGAIAGYFAAFAPFFGGYLLEGFGWRIVFFAIAVAAIVSLVWSARRTWPIEEDAPRETRPWTDIASLAPRSLWLIFGYIFCTYGCITFFAFDAALVLESRAFGPLFVMAFFATIWLTFATLSSLVKAYVDTPRVRVILLAAPIFIVLGVVLLRAGGTVSPLLGAAAVGVGFAFSNAPSTHLVLRLAPKGLRALAASFDITLARLGGVLTVSFLAAASSRDVILAVALLMVAAFALGWSGSSSSSGRRRN